MWTVKQTWPPWKEASSFVTSRSSSPLQIIDLLIHWLVVWSIRRRNESFSVPRFILFLKNHSDWLLILWRVGVWFSSWRWIDSVLVFIADHLRTHTLVMWRVFICFSHLLFMNDWFIDYFCWLNPFFFSSLHQIKLIFHLVCNFVFFISVRSLPVWWRHTLLPPIITSLIDRQSADYFLNFGRKLNVCFLINLKMKKKTSWHQKTINSESEQFLNHFTDQ